TRSKRDWSSDVCSSDLRCCVCCPPRCRSRCCCSRCWELCLPPCCLASCCVPPSCLPFWPGCGSSSEPTPCESGTCEAAGSTDGSGGRNTGEGAATDGVRDSDLLCPASSCDGWACPPVFGAPVAVPAVSVAAAWVVFDSAWVVFDSACVVFDTAVSATCCSA